MAKPVPTPPEIVADRYLIGRSIGVGSSGAVYRVRDRTSGEALAIKLRPATDTDQPVRFIAEAQAMMRLKHPRLVHVLDMGQHERFYWYTMPYYPNGSLRDWVKKEGPLSPAQALEWTFQILEGVHAVHEAHLVHRDVKPHNVLLGDDNQLLLTDFGLIRHVQGGVPYRTRTDQSMGTPNYRAPEQAADAASVDRRADIYGVGATLYFLLTGKRPSFLYMVEAEDPEMQGVVPSLRPFILRCMAFAPDERYDSALDCATELVALYDALPSRQGQRPIASSWLRRFKQEGGGILEWIRSLWAGQG